MTHRDLCRLAARWLLDRRGCWCAVDELAFDSGVADAVGTSQPDVAGEVELKVGTYRRSRALVEAKRKRREKRAAKKRVVDLDAVARADDATRVRRVKASGPPLIAVVECKRTRADWLHDIEAQKLRRYEPCASECWLLVAPEVVTEKARLPKLVSAWGLAEYQRTLDVLTDDGLPASWGVLLVEPLARGPVVEKLRAATELRAIEEWEAATWCGRVARSLSYRLSRAA